MAMLIWIYGISPVNGKEMFYVQVLPSQFNPVVSREKPLWHSQVKLPGVFWQIPFDPQSKGCDPHSLLSRKK